MKEQEKEEEKEVVDKKEWEEIEKVKNKTNGSMENEKQNRWKCSI